MSPHNTLQRELEIDFEMADPGNGKAIRPDRNRAVIHLVSAAAETRSLPDPLRSGQELVLTMLTDGGDIVVTAASPLNQTGNTIITFGAVQDTVVLRSMRDGAATYRWTIIGNDGGALS